MSDEGPNVDPDSTPSRISSSSSPPSPHAPSPEFFTSTRKETKACSKTTNHPYQTNLKSDVQKWRDEILEVLDRDILACDVQLSLFASAANSYRFDSILKPFPSFLDKNCEKSIEKLRGTLQFLPDLESLRDRLKSGQFISNLILSLVHWVLLGNPLGLRLKTISNKEEVLKLPTDQTNKTSLSHRKSTKNVPTHIFQIETTKTKKWEEENSATKLHFGYHGSRTDNFHSILSHGLQQHLTTNALFGSGIYFSSDLNMSLSYSKVGQTWNKSLLGNQLSCVVMCQIKDDVEVKLHTKDPDRNYVDGSEGGKVPEKYLIVRNNDLIQNKYLLVYAKEQVRTNPTNAHQSSSAIIPSWVRNNKFLLMLIGYAFLLLGIGIANSTQFKRFLRRNGIIQD